MEPLWIVALATVLATLPAALGVLPGRGPERVPAQWLGWANASAAGLMLGGAFVLAERGLGLAPLTGMLGVTVGIGVVMLAHGWLGTEEEGLNRQDLTDDGYGGRVLAVQTLHGALEGVAVGMAAVLDLGLGLFLALTFAIHNAAEGAVLCAVLRSVGSGAGRAASLAVVSNAGQPLLAVATFALLEPGGHLASGALGVATGSLVYLVTVDLLPEAYKQAGEMSIALVTSLLMGVVLLLRGTLLP
ncbi:MAG TPA: hypothetical protein VLL48_03515 [Longimicrobiales bacterium]|nr:hypothetical protein [Longimicrobiales bacterium]